MPDEDVVGSVGCYRRKFDGQYKTFYPSDFAFRAEWIFIHSGQCECEGKIAGLECLEPGDEN